MAIRKEWNAYGFKCLVLDNPFQSFNGYVALTKEHPCYGLDYDNISVNIHGGLTYDGYGSDKPNKEGEILFENPELYWVGFDTAHSGDWVGYAPERGGKRWNIEMVAEETEQLAKQLQMIQNGEPVKREPTDEESKKLLNDLKVAIDELEGVKIPFNIIKDYIQPLKEWLDNL